MIHLKNVSKIYPNGNEALKNISLDIAPGEFVFIVGPSGAGKSTFLKLLTREEKATFGKIRVNGRDLMKIRNRKIPYLRRTMGMVFQDFRLIQKMTVFDNVAFAMRVIGEPEKAVRKRVKYVLKSVGLEGTEKRRPNELSGGEQQRVCLARALVNRPELLIADEPTGNIDPERSYEIMKMLVAVNQRGTTVLIVTHEHDLVKEIGGRLIRIADGEITHDTFLTSQFFPEPPLLSGMSSPESDENASSETDHHTIPDEIAKADGSGNMTVSDHPSVSKPTAEHSADSQRKDGESS